jgi:hypothetical protein
MTRLTVDAALLARLHNLDQTLEVCDESGRTLGYFHPVPAAGHPPAPSPFSEEELRRRQQQRTGRSLAEILERLDRSCDSR